MLYYIIYLFSHNYYIVNITILHLKLYIIIKGITSWYTNYDYDI